MYTMNDFPELTTSAKKAINTHPILKNEINDIVLLAIDEANDGGSLHGEEESAIISIDEIIDEQIGRAIMAAEA